MKRISLAVLFSFSIAGSAFAASNNTISFQGEVTDQTCSVTVNGESSSPLILLPTVAATELSASGITAGTTPFVMGVSCDSAATADTKISTVFVGNNVSADGNLGNTGTAENVEIQILDSKGTAISSLANYKASNDLALASGESSSSAEYKAQYFATGKAGKGTVLASMQYSISYQ